MTFGLKVSKKGIDVGTAINASDIAFDSQYAVPKVSDAQAGSVTIAQGGRPTITIEHGLGYAPIAMAYVEDLPGTGLRSAASTGDVTVKKSLWTVEVDTTNVYIRKIADQGSENGTYDYFYYIFKDPV